MRALSEFSGTEFVKRQEIVQCKVSSTGVEILQGKPEVC